MKIGPVLNVKLYLHEGRYCIDIMIESLFEDRTISWVRIVNGFDEYVTETSEEIPIENDELFISTGKPKPKSVANSSVNVPIRERKWIDIDPQPFDHSCSEVSKFMTRTLRHEYATDSQNLGEFSGKKEEEGRKKRFQYCLNPYSSNEFLIFRSIQGHLGEDFVDPLLQDNIQGVSSNRRCIFEQKCL